MVRRTLAAVLAALAAVVLAACTTVPGEIKQAAGEACPPGSACYDEPKPVGPGGKLAVIADEFLFNVKSQNIAGQGPIEVTLDNVGQAEHNLTIDQAYGNKRVPPGDQDLAPGQTSKGTLQLFPGTYTYYCSVPGHREQGMEATITIPSGGGQAAGGGQ